MIIANYIKASLKEKNNCHSGIGTIYQKDLFIKSDFETNLKFINYSVLPSGTSIGNHKHGDNEEIYVILEGKGHMYVEGEVQSVSEGDVVVNKPFGTHGLVNDYTDDLRILVFEVEK